MVAMVNLPKLWEHVEKYKKKYQKFLPKDTEPIIFLPAKSLNEVPKILDEPMVRRMVRRPSKGVFLTKDWVLSYECKETNNDTISWELYFPNPNKKEEQTLQGKGWVSLYQTGILDPYWLPPEEKGEMEKTILATFDVFETLDGTPILDRFYATDSSEIEETAIRLITKAWKEKKEKITHITAKKKSNSSDWIPLSLFFLLIYKVRKKGFGRWEVTVEQMSIGHSPVWDELWVQGNKDAVLNDLMIIANLV